MEWLEGQKGRKLKWQESKMKGTWKEDQKEKETNGKREIRGTSQGHERTKGNEGN